MTVVSIQYLRALAACMVVVFHIGFIFGWAWGPGASGVDVFFVISGFIMWVVTADRETTPGNFFWHRLIRIVPLYWTLTLIFVAGAFIIPSQFTGRPGLGHIVQSLLFIPHLAPNGNNEPVILQGWTLNYEMFFYAVFALSLLLPRAARLYALSGAMLVVAGLLLQPSLPAARTYTSPMLLEFLAGVWIGHAWLNQRLPSLPAALTLIALGVVALMAPYWYDGSGGYRALFWGAPAALIVIGSIAVERLGRMPGLGAVKLIGDASYSIYLSHPLSIIACKYLLSKMGLERWGGPIYLSVALFCVVSLVAVAAGLICYWGLERPLTRMFRPPARRVADPAKAMS